MYSKREKVIILRLVYLNSVVRVQTWRILKILVNTKQLRSGVFFYVLKNTLSVIHLYGYFLQNCVIQHMYHIQVYHLSLCKQSIHKTNLHIIRVDS